MSIKQRLGNRAAVVVAATVGFVIGGMGLVAASQSSSLFGDDTPTSADVTTPNSVDDTTNSTPNSVDDDSSSSVPDNSTANSSPGLPMPAAFTETYNSAGGSITVTWSGTKFTLDSVSAAAGFVARIEDQRWDRVRVDFEGNDGDARIEVRLSDDDNSIRVRID